MTGYDHLERLKTARIQPSLCKEGFAWCQAKCPSRYTRKSGCRPACSSNPQTTSLAPRGQDCYPFQRLMAEALRPKETTPQKEIDQ